MKAILFMTDLARFDLTWRASEIEKDVSLHCTKENEDFLLVQYPPKMQKREQ